MRISLCAGTLAVVMPPAFAAQTRSTTTSTEGRELYERFCAQCHGAHGEGAADWQSRDRNGEMPAPPHDKHGHTWKHSDEMLYRVVRNGWRDPFNHTQRLTMPPFNDLLSPQQTIAVIDYLKERWTPEQRQFQAEESRGHAFPSP